MKKRYLTRAKANKSHQSKKSFLQSTNTYMALFSSAFFVFLFISACSPESSSENSLLITEQSAANLDRKLQNAEDIEENIINSYARLAAKRSDVCPKLIQEALGSQVIERTSEVMVNKHCDYFLYPREGQRISVSVNDSQIEALLIVPALHNFANGDYKVDSYDKHVIRLSYSGATYKPKNLVYDVAVTVSS
ncbi:hypothetical protein [Psychrobacter namhaensis]|jgi:hypothetical protein|uniref:hypothetical protein n=1 Tax=Psychrobacter namhaensis TaxID=292734 RepID=UPI0018DF046C|nr:hypothetical protein [Psychrobacter namhaensis]